MRQPKPGGGKYGIVEDYGGHGIGTEMHMDPHLLNYVERRRGKGPKLVPGFCLAIEPMVSLGTPRTEVLEDDWTVITTDGTWSSHWEHSVALTEDGPLVLTAPDGGKAKLAEFGITTAPDPLVEAETTAFGTRGRSFTILLAFPFLPSALLASPSSLWRSAHLRAAPSSRPCASRSAPLLAHTTPTGGASS